MYNKVEISIPNPCEKEWNKMSAAKDGKFCVSCSKIVIDFTQMSNQEIAAYLLKNPAKTTCGHFRKAQIKTEQNAFHNFLLSFYCTLNNSKQSLVRKLFMVLISSILTLTGCSDLATGKIDADVEPDSLHLSADTLKSTTKDSLLGKVDSVQVDSSLVHKK